MICTSSCIYWILLASSIVSCNAEHVNSWWKHTIVYQIYPRSFQDSDGDGVGDIKGIISRLDHFNYLHIGAIWLSPIYKSPMVDHGYDVEDYTDIDPIFGTLADFDELLTQAHNRGIRIIMDFIPNHTSNKHKWFIESQRGSDNSYSDYYIWNDGRLLDNGTRVPPNNWLSCFTGPAWTWDSTRNQYYYHQFCPEQPDLNYRNPQVREQMEQVLQFWLDRGVDGFRVDAIATLFEAEDVSLKEEPSFLEGVLPHEEMYLKHTYTRSLPEIHEVMREWRQLFDQHYKTTGKYTFMMAEVYETLDSSMKYYSSGADFPLNMLLITRKSNCSGKCYRELIDEWLNSMPAGKWPNFVIGNHDRPRVSERKGHAYVNAMNVLLLTLPGTPTTYYGEELGMNEISISYEDTQDPWGRNLGPDLYQTASRDPCRTPMQWDDSHNAGFSTADKTWLPVHPNHNVVNVKNQQTDSRSPLEVYRQVAGLRADVTSFHTQHVMFLDSHESVVAYVRYNPDAIVSTAPYLIAINLGSDDITDIGTSEVQLLGSTYSQGKIILDTSNDSQLGQLLRLKDLHLSQGQALILKLVVVHKDEF